MESRELAPTYDAYYFQHGCGGDYHDERLFREFFARVAKHIVRDLRPATVLDAGCAMGYLVAELRNLGVEAYGVDISSYAIGKVPPEVRPYCRVGSVTEPFGQRYDLIVNIEVLEHMPREEAERAVANFCAHSDDVLFSSTPLDYKEATHLNVRPPEYWTELFARHGFIRDVDFDSTFLTPWSRRFRKSREPLSRVVAAYERRQWLLEQENGASRTLVIEQRNRLAEQDRALAEARAARDRATEEAQAILAAAGSDQERCTELRGLSEAVDQKVRQAQAYFFNVPAARLPRFRRETLPLLHPLCYPREWSTTRLRDVEVLGSDSHLLWHLKGPQAEVVVQVNLVPGRYYFHGRAMAHGPGQLRLDAGSSGAPAAAQLDARPTDLFVPFDLTAAAQRLTLTWSGPACWLADFQLLGAESETLLHTVERNLRARLAKYPPLLWTARQIKKIVRLARSCSGPLGKGKAFLRRCRALWAETLKPQCRRALEKRPLLGSAARRGYRVLRRGMRPLVGRPAPEVLAPVAAPPSARSWSDPVDDQEEYRRWIEKRQAERQASICIAPHSGLFSILTTVWNTPVAYLEAMAASLFAQKPSATFEWIVLDNGSTDPEVRSWLTGLASHPQVKLFRVEENLGIIGGQRYCLEKASGRYILPVDSDDLLYPDALAVMAGYIRKHHNPPLLYSDEDKIQDDCYRAVYLKPAWDPVLFLNFGYIAHLGAIDREMALQLGAYTDGETNGSHDCDTFLRFMLAGHQPVHVPEVLYTWRMHPGSCALTLENKPYVYASWNRVLCKFLAAHPQGHRYRHAPATYYPWWIRREHTDPRPLLTLVLTSPGEEVDPRAWRESASYPLHEVRPLVLEGGKHELYRLAETAARDHGLIQLAAAGMRIDGNEWPWEVLTLMELHPDTVAVGGRVLDDRGAIVTAGEVLGFGGSCGCPDEYRHGDDPGYYHHLMKQRSVSAVSSLLAVVDAAFLADCLRRHRHPRLSLRYLGAWLGAHAWRTGKRVVYTPHLTGRLPTHPQWYAFVSQEEKDALTASIRDLLPDSRYHSRHLSLNPATPYRLATQAERQALLPPLLARSA